MTAQDRAAPSLIWHGELDHPNPESTGQWRVVLTEGTFFNGRYHEREPRLVIERATRQATLGEPVWEPQAGLPDEVLLELLRSQQPPPIDDQVRELLGGGAA